ncbi:MAG: hypothetical protein QM796_06470 [Chthoniobacteraceae bacterium]
MVPYRVLKGSATPPNLVKQSVYNSTFFPSTASTAYPSGGSGNYPASNRAANVSSATDVSQNGRSISLARWNKPLFLQAATNSTAPADTNIKSPDWVLVTRNGNNPTSWSVNLGTKGAQYTGTASTDGGVVIGRYAYNIYDEGGLLDANVAGYPSTSTAAHTVYKLGPSYADLTQIFQAAGATAANATIYSDKLVGWRNYASSQITTAFPNLTYAGTGTGVGTPENTYYNFVQGNTTGFLRTANLALQTGQGGTMSDHLFSTRQQLISFLGAATNGASDALNALQYLTTFSRDLNQPSITPALSFDSTAPKVLATSAGGNNATGLDGDINPAFGSIRVATSNSVSPVRNDGSPFVKGEPLVKKRFNLNRLAWLTYAGPIANNAGTALNPTNDSGVDTIINTLETTYGFSKEFLLQGTEQNIENYFGLEWKQDSTDNNRYKWFYDKHNGSGSGSGAIMKLKDIAALNPPREADFFEILKASVNVGSIAKSATPQNPTGLTNAFGVQARLDYSVDYAIIQMGANIIDQFDLDGFSTRISFDDSSGAQEFRGIENLPYLSRILGCVIKASQYTSTSSGLGVLMQEPELWNPHDYGTTNGQLNQTDGVVGPTNFRIYATSDPYQIVATKGVIPNIKSSVGADPSLPQSGQYQSAGRVTGFGFNYGNPEQRQLTLNNTQMTFQVDRTTSGVKLFREPTILFQPLKPTGSKLASTPLSAPSSTNLGNLAKTSSLFVPAGTPTGIKSDVSSSPIPTQGSPYVGFYIGGFPLQWSDGTVYLPDAVSMVASANMHYYLQYRVPCWLG